jgi:TRAP-type transport system small permease protein
MNAIERALTLAFIGAVALNFANVVGRYLLGRSIFGADEVQVYVMVCMAFLGAGIVTWREQHLRMDVLLRFLPAPARQALRAAELLLLFGLASFVVVQSIRYAAQMFAIAARSSAADIPMWLPHSAVAAGFALIALVALRRVVACGAQRRKQAAQPAGDGASP